MSDSEPEIGPAAAQEQRVKRHRFKTFSELISEVRGQPRQQQPCCWPTNCMGLHPHQSPRHVMPPVRRMSPPCDCSLPPSSLPQIDVDVYRRVGPVRAEPWQGASSFFQEHLIKWRELNSASHFLRVRGARLSVREGTGTRDSGDGVPGFEVAKLLLPLLLLQLAVTAEATVV